MLTTNSQPEKATAKRRTKALGKTRVLSFTAAIALVSLIGAAGEVALPHPAGATVAPRTSSWRPPCKPPAHPHQYSSGKNEYWNYLGKKRGYYFWEHKFISKRVPGAGFMTVGNDGLADPYIRTTVIESCVVKGKTIKWVCPPFLW